MKRRVRRNVFETNSSSTHTISIAKKSNFDNWKAGKMYARRSAAKEECNETWGNFWSEQRYWEFEAIDAQEAEARNRKIYEDINRQWAQVSERFEMTERYELLKPIDKVCSHMWVTYDEYMKYLRQTDCYSPFEHPNLTEDVEVFGYYFHS